jgi:hypothetical protein
LYHYCTTKIIFLIGIFFGEIMTYRDNQRYNGTQN